MLSGTGCDSRGCAGPGVGLRDPCQSVPAQVIPWFCGCVVLGLSASAEGAAEQDVLPAGGHSGFPMLQDLQLLHRHTCGIENACTEGFFTPLNFIISL